MPGAGEGEGVSPRDCTESIAGLGAVEEWVFGVRGGFHGSVVFGLKEVVACFESRVVLSFAKRDVEVGGFTETYVRFPHAELGEEIRVQATGPDAQEAAAAVVHFLESGGKEPVNDRLKSWPPSPTT